MLVALPLVAALHAADAAFGRHGPLWRSRWSRGGVVADAGERQQQRQQQIPFGNDKQRGMAVAGLGIACSGRGLWPPRTFVALPLVAWWVVVHAVAAFGMRCGVGAGMVWVFGVGLGLREC